MQPVPVMAGPDSALRVVIMLGRLTRSVLFWGGLPLVLPQAIRVRKNAPRFAGAGGPRTGVAGSGREYDLIAIGDSIIAGVGARSLDHALVGQTASSLSDELGCRVRWRALGSIGANSSRVLHRLLPDLHGIEADFIVLSVGVNDVTSLTTVRRWSRNLGDILTALRKHSPRAIIAVVGLPPLRGFPLLPQPLRALFGLRGETLDDVARRVISQHPSVVHVPLDFEPEPESFAGDGFHPSEPSYRELGLMTGRWMVAGLGGSNHTG